MTEHTDKNILKEITQMANIHMEMCATFLETKKCQLKILRYILQNKITIKERTSR